MVLYRQPTIYRHLGKTPQQHHGRLQTLVCWQRSDAQRADIVYAAWTAGVRMSLTEFA